MLGHENHIFTMATDFTFRLCACSRENSQSDSDESEISELAEFWWSYGKCGNMKYKRRDVNIRVDFAIYLQIFASLVIVDL